MIHLLGQPHAGWLAAPEILQPSTPLQVLNSPRNLLLDETSRKDLDPELWLGLLPFVSEAWEMEPVRNALAFDGVWALNWILSKGAALPPSRASLGLRVNAMHKW
jgi:hypothetical protein